MQGPPTFLVLDKDGKLHAYYREELLRIDLAINRDEPPQQLFKMATNSLTLSYYPINATEIASSEALLIQPSTEVALLPA
jgi:hypothetical protein